jgi:hypothetical protein
MQITKIEPVLEKKGIEKKSLKPFLADEDPQATGFILPLLTPFQNLNPDVEDFSSPTQQIDFFCQGAKEALKHKFLCLKKEGFESTQFSVVLDLKKIIETVSFEVRYFDTAKMEIQVEMQGSDQALKELLSHLSKLYQEISLAVFPYDLQLLIPQSQQKLLPPSVSIKDLCKQHRTVYGVNEDEQAP